MPEKTLDSRVVRTVRQLRSNSAYRCPNGVPPRPFRTTDHKIRIDVANKENLGHPSYSRPSSSNGRNGRMQQPYYSYAQDEALDDSQHHSFEHRLGSKFVGLYKETSGF